MWSQVITLLMVLGATLSHDYSTFTAFRSLQGLFGTVPQVIGLPIIHDMYSASGKPPDATWISDRDFVDDILIEWPRMINIWSVICIISAKDSFAHANWQPSATKD